jgi:Dolichyl-phosphate-mannose-protein mannosyltransferase
MGFHQGSVSESGSAEVGGGLAGFLGRHPGRALWLCTAWFLVAEMCKDARRPFWFDELVALSLAGAPKIGRIWEVIEQGAELNPPLSFWVQWVVSHTFGQGEVISRLPAALGFWTMCVCLYFFVRRRTDAAYGFVALVFPVFTYTSWFGTYARGYGMMLGAAGAAMLCWQMATEAVGQRRRGALAGLAVAVAVMVSCHYYAAYVAGAIGLGELVRTRVRKALDLPVWIALCVGLSPLAIYLPLLRRTAAAARTFWVPAEVGFIQDCYTELLGATLLVILIWQWYAAVDSEEPEPTLASSKAAPWPMHEAVACLTLLAMPLVVGIAAQLAPIVFYKYYVQPVVLGATVVLALFAYRVTVGSAKMRRVTLGLAIWAGFVPWGLFQGFKLAVMPPPAEIALGQFRNFLATPLPLVVDSNDRFLKIYHYGPTDVRKRLFVVSDKAASVQFLGSDTALRSLELMNTILPVPLVNYHEFLRAHGEFALALPNAESWLVQQLLADGARVELARYEKALGPFADELFVFHVWAPR